MNKILILNELKKILFKDKYRTEEIIEEMKLWDETP